GPDRVQLTVAARAALAAAEEVRDLVEVGAYVAGTNPAADKGLRLSPDLIELFRQRPHEASDFGEAWSRLEAIVGGAARRGRVSTRCFGCGPSGSGKPG